MKRAAVVALLLLSGCEVGPNYHAPPPLRGGAPVPALASGQAAVFDPEAPPPADWWRIYNDPVLDGLEKKALVRNTDLRVAFASLEQAQATLNEIRGERLPQTSLSINPTYGQGSADAAGAPKALEPSPFYAAMENISYDLDLFGRLRRSLEAGRASVGAAAAALDLARVNVAGETAGAYASACTAGLEIAVTRRSITLARQILDVTEQRYEGGVQGFNDVVRARTVLRQTAAALPALIGQQRAALFLLATLTGDPPEEFPPAVARCDTPPVIREPIPIGDGATLLARRPDVREAERNLAAAVAGIGVSTAALYPSVTLGGGFGTEAAKLSHITEARAFVWNIGPLISWNFPNLSIARAQLAASSAAARQALASFDGTVLTALRETETALTNLAQQLDTENQLAAARDDATLARINTMKLYQGGIGAFLDVLSAEQTEIQAENTLAQATAQVAQDQVSLFMALGGGWQNAPAVAATSLKPVTGAARAR